MFKNIYLSFFLIASAISLSYSQTSNDSFREEENIYEKIANITVRVHDREMKLSDIYSESPVIIAQIFTRCTGICSPSLGKLKQNLHSIKPAEKYKIVVLSFDPRDTGKDMLRLSENFGLDRDTNWVFATSGQIDVLNHSVGFRYSWDDLQQQYEHDALLTGVSRQGIIKKKLIGIRDANTIAGMLREINNGFAPSYPLPVKNKIFSCFNYNPATGKSEPGTGLFLMSMPAIVTFLLVLSLKRKVVPEQD